MPSARDGNLFHDRLRQTRQLVLRLVDAMRGAVSGRFMNVLVTDEDVAGALLKR